MTWINEGLPTAMKLRSSPTTRSPAKTAVTLSVQEDIPLTSCLSASLEALYTLKSKGATLLQTEPRCCESSEIIRTKILDLFSKEISLYEKALLQETLTGA